MAKKFALYASPDRQSTRLHERAFDIVFCGGRVSNITLKVTLNSRDQTSERVSDADNALQNT